MATRAAAWAQRYSLGGLKSALQNLMEERWKCRVEFSPAQVESLNR
jgi:hypothetical protein